MCNKTFFGATQSVSISLCRSSLHIPTAQPCGFRCLPPTVQRETEKDRQRKTKKEKEARLSEERGRGGPGQTVTVCVSVFVGAGMFESKPEVIPSCNMTK